MAGKTPKVAPVIPAPTPNKILIASDHAGFELKEYLKKELGTDFPFVDLGTTNQDSVDYPDYADLLCQKLIADQRLAYSNTTLFGVLICGSGVGICIRANRYPQIRAVQVWSEDIAKLSREHNDANVACFGERAQDKVDCLNMLETFLTTKFLGENAAKAGSPNAAAIRHLKRVKKLSAPVKL